jgi:tetratricopeptide (TPR) repeat protein
MASPRRVHALHLVLAAAALLPTRIHAAPTESGDGNGPVAEAEAEAQPGDEAGPNADPSPADDLEAQAVALYDEGQALYSAADYTGAIDKFTAALALISSDDTRFDSEARGRLLYNLATAHDRAFNVEQDDKHLRAARELYQRIVDEGPTIGYSDDLVRQAADAREIVDARLRAAEPPPAEPAAAPPATPSTDTDPGGDGHGLVIAGAAVLGLSAASCGIWIAGIVLANRAEDDVRATTAATQQPQRLDAIDRGHLGKTLGVVGAVVSGTLLVTGATLLGLGLSKRARTRTALAPFAGPGLVGVTTEVRF